MIEILSTKLQTEWSDALLDAGLTLHPPISFIQTGGIRGSDRKVNFLVFDSSKDEPVLILKLARSVKHQLQLKQEYESLCKLRAFVSIAESVPHPIGIFEINGHLVVGESFVAGIPLSLLLRRQKRTGPESVEQDLRLALSWIAMLQNDGSVEKGEWWGRNLKERFPDIPSQNFRHDLQREIQRFDGISMPLTASHGDFWPGNILINGNGMGVIDWEGFQPKRSPLWDSFLFITTYARSYPWHGWKWMLKHQTFEKAFLEENWFSRNVRQYIQQCLKRAQLPISAAHLLFSEFLLCKAEAEKGSDPVQWREYFSLYSQNCFKSILRGAES